MEEVKSYKTGTHAVYLYHEHPYVEQRYIIEVINYPEKDEERQTFGRYHRNGLKNAEAKFNQEKRKLKKLVKV